MIQSIAQPPSAPLSMLPAGLRGRVLFNEPLSKHTTWRVGGPADVFFTPEDKQDLSWFLRCMDGVMPVMWLGLGSNLLVRDGGIRAAVIETHGGLDDLQRLSENEVWCDAGVPCAKLAKQCAKWNLGPAEFFAGIPGTLGGALAMNAGAFGGETWRHVVEVETVNRRGEVQRRKASDYQIAYRHVAGPDNEWFLGAQLSFAIRGDSLESGEAEIRALLKRRKETQPIGIFLWLCIHQSARSSCGEVD